MDKILIQDIIIICLNNITWQKKEKYFATTMVSDQR